MRKAIPWLVGLTIGVVWSKWGPEAIGLAILVWALYLGIKYRKDIF